MNPRNSQWFVLSLLCFLLVSSKIHLTIAADTISSGQSLTGNQTIISKGGIFELGFFRPGKSQNYYIGIWYKKVTVPTVVWVANRANPILDIFSSKLTLLGTGNLVIINQINTTIWSTVSASNTLNTTEAVLGDDGNLVLRDGSDPSVVFWQSFDHPTNTFLPGAKIGLNKRTNQSQLLTSWRNEEDPAPGIFSLELDPSGTSQFLIKRNGSKQVWISGEWNGQTHAFSLLPEMRLNYIYNYSYITNDYESYFTYSLYNKSILSRLVMDVSGQIKQSTWLQKNKQWNIFWSQPRQLCDIYGICGPFGTCNLDSLKCYCLPGFMKRSPKDWDLSDTTSGCVRNTSLQCGNKGVFSRMANMKMPEDPKPLPVGNAEECALVCSSICSCNAYAYNSSGCSYWDGDLIDLRQLSVGGEDLFIKIGTTDIRLSKGRKTLIWKIIIPIITLVTITLGVLGYIYLLRRNKAQRGRLKGFQGVLTDLFKTTNTFKDCPNRNMFKDGKSEGETLLQLFDLASLAAATNNFCLKNKLGEGGFGPVYKGKLQNGKEIAVKRLSKSSVQGIEEFKNEVTLISKLQHKNLVKLLGCYIEGEENVLIYEYMPNKSLDTFLFDPRKKAQLDWDKRFNIIGGIARGLLYLHRDSRLKVIHRDLKVSNILLDEDMNPKISDFGMARIFGGNQTIANTRRVVGTFGYMPPEYIMGGTFSEKSDVFSFGVLILEIVSSKKNNSFYDPEQPLNLLLHTWRLWNEGKWSEIIDEALDGVYSPLEVRRCILIGLLCVQNRAVDRPTMAAVDLMLSSDTDCPSPKEPPFTSGTSSDKSDILLQTLYSNNNLSLTVLDGR